MSSFNNKAYAYDLYFIVCKKVTGLDSVPFESCCSKMLTKGIKQQNLKRVWFPVDLHVKYPMQSPTEELSDRHSVSLIVTHNVIVKVHATQLGKLKPHL